MSGGISPTDPGVVGTSSYGSAENSSLTQSGHFSVKDGTKIYYELHGTGKHKVVLIAGFATAALTWRGLTAFLVEASIEGGLQVICMDNRGCGRSDRPTGYYTTTLLASDVHSLLKERLRLDKYHLVGHSMGGMIALELALMDPRSLQSLVLYSTHAGGLRAIAPFRANKLFYRYYKPGSSKEQVAAAILSVQYPSSYLSAPCPIPPHKTWSEYHVSLLLEELECGHGYETINIGGQLSAVFRHRVTRSRLVSLRQSLLNRAPILVINGVVDDLVRTENSQYLSKVLKCPLERIDGCGHMSHLQNLPRFGEVLLKHLAGAIEGNQAVELTAGEEGSSD